MATVHINYWLLTCDHPGCDAVLDPPDGADGFDTLESGVVAAADSGWVFTGVRQLSDKWLPNCDVCPAHVETEDGQ